MENAIQTYRIGEYSVADKRRSPSLRLQTVMTDEHTDLLLFGKFIAGDNAAFSELYGRHNQRLFNYCAKILGDHQSAEDITHTLWERVIGLRSQFDSVSNPLGFLFRTARNLCYDHLKHLKYQTTIETIPEALHPVSGNAELSEEEELVILALQKLPSETREILILTYYSGYSAEEIAEMLGKKTNAIWTRISRARVELKKIIEKQLLNTQRNTHE